MSVESYCYQATYKQTKLQQAEQYQKMQNPHIYAQSMNLKLLISSKYFLLLLFLLSIPVNSSSSFSLQEDQQQPQLYSSLYWNIDKHHQTYQNLFSVYKQINITSRLIIKSSIQQKTITTQSTTLILEQDYLNMYKNKLGYKLKFNLTDQLFTAIQKNHTFVETSFYFVDRNKNYLVEKQLIPVLGEFKHDWREGIEHIVLADLDLTEKEQPHQMALKQMDIFFFQIDQDLPFQKDFEGSQAFGIVQVELSNNKAVQYYYPRPLATKINTQLKENYIPLQNLHKEFKQTESTSHKLPKCEIRINLRIGSHLFPLMMHTFQAFHDRTEQVTFQIDGMEFGLGKGLEVAGPFIIRYFKKVLFEGSLLGWVFLFVQTFITLCSKMTSFIAIIFEIQIFNKIIQYRGVSLYSILTFIWIDIILIVVSYGYLRIGDFFGPLVSLVIGIWKIKKMARVEMFWEYPFVEIGNSPWYENYSEEDKKSLIESLLPCSLFVTLVVAYPFFCQNYFGSQLSAEQSLIKYILHRFVLTINEYRFLIAMLPQILLNYKLKSCNALPWKLLIVLVWFYSVDNLLVPVSTSIWEVVFYLKEEIFIGVLIGQKLFFGNNLEMLPVEEERKKDNTEHKINNEEQNKINQQQQNSNVNEPQNQQKKQNLQSKPTNQTDEIDEKPKLD